MSSWSFGARLRIGITAFVILASPVSWLSGQESPSAKKPVPEVATMPGMRSLVPTLVAVGWENFFLDLRRNLKLSPHQSQQLYFIRQRYVANSDELEKQLAQAQLGLYQNLGEDMVSSSELESDLKKIAELKAAISVLHFKAALEAVNVLDHRQHLRAKELLKLRMEMWQQTPSERKVRRYRVRETLRARLIGRPQWPSNFTPHDLWWKGW